MRCEVGPHHLAVHRLGPAELLVVNPQNEVAQLLPEAPLRWVQEVAGRDAVGLVARESSGMTWHQEIPRPVGVPYQWIDPDVAQAPRAFRFRVPLGVEVQARLARITPDAVNVLDRADVMRSDDGRWTLREPPETEVAVLIEAVKSSGACRFLHAYRRRAGTVPARVPLGLLELTSIYRELWTDPATHALPTLARARLTVRAIESVITRLVQSRRLTLEASLSEVVQRIGRSPTGLWEIALDTLQGDGPAVSLVAELERRGM